MIEYVLILCFVAHNLENNDILYNSNLQNIPLQVSIQYL